MVPPKGARKEWGKSVCCFKLDPVTHVEGRPPVWVRARSTALAQQWVRRLLSLQQVLMKAKKHGLGTAGNSGIRAEPLQVDMTEIFALKAGRTPFIRNAAASDKAKFAALDSLHGTQSPT